MLGAEVHNSRGIGNYFVLYLDLCFWRMGVSHLPRGKTYGAHWTEEPGKTHSLSTSLVILGRSSTYEYCEMQFRISERILSLQWPSHEFHFTQLEPLHLELHAGLACGSRAMVLKCGPRWEAAALPWNLIVKYIIMLHLRYPESEILCFHMSSGDSDVCLNLRTTDIGQILASSTGMIQHLEALCFNLCCCRQTPSNIQVELQIQPMLFLFPWCSHPFVGYPWLLTDSLSCHLPRLLNNNISFPAGERQF